MLKEFEKEQNFHDLLKQTARITLIGLTRKAQAEERARLELELRTIGLNENDHQHIDEMYKQNSRHENEIARIKSMTLDQIYQETERIFWRE